MKNKINCTFLLLLLIIIFCDDSYADEYLKVKGDYIKSCEIKKPNFTACSTESINNLFYKLIHEGFDGFEDFITVDPLKLKRIQIFQGDGPVSMNSSLTNSIVTGFSNMVITESKVSPVDYSWVTKIHLPKMKIAGQYSMQGRILVIPLNGHGKCWFEPVNMDILLKTKTHLYEKDGHIFYNVTNTKVDYTISGLRLQLDNLFDGVTLLEDSTNAYLNENWRPVAEALKPIIAQTIEEILLKLLQQIFHFMPAEYLVSDIAKPSELYGE